MSWPETADGDVFRRLQASQFDFSSAHEIDFNVDFEDWPPARDAIQWLEREFARIYSFPPTGDFGGYVQFKLVEMLTYDLVILTQDRVSAAMAVYGGVCESWGVLQPAPQ